MEFGKVVDRQEDFISLLRLMDLVRPIMPPPARNELVLYAASTVRHQTNHISLTDTASVIRWDTLCAAATRWPRPVNRLLRPFCAFLLVAMTGPPPHHGQQAHDRQVEGEDGGEGLPGGSDRHGGELVKCANLGANEAH